MEDLESLMSEPPGGTNYGRAHTAGRWVVLNPDEQSAHQDGLWIDGPDIKPRYVRPKKPVDTIRHGTAAAYQHDRCRCAECRTGWALYKRERRRRSG